MARFKPGQSGNPSGRKKGAKNKTTEQLRAAVQTLIESNWDTIQEDYDNLKPPERLNFLVSLLKFVLPPPITIEALSEDQLKQLYQYIVKKFDNGKSGNNTEY